VRLDNPQFVALDKLANTTGVLETVAAMATGSVVGALKFRESILNIPNVITQGRQNEINILRDEKDINQLFAKVAVISLFNSPLAKIAQSLTNLNLTLPLEDPNNPSNAMCLQQVIVNRLCIGFQSAMQNVQKCYITAC